MAVAKRQRRENPCKWNKGRSEHQSETKVKQSASWLVQFTYGRLRGRGKNRQREAKIEPLSSLG